MKKIVSVILSLFIILTFIPVFAESSITVTVNGVKLELPKEPIAIDGRVYVPASTLAKALGADIAGRDKNLVIVGKDEIKLMLSGSGGVYRFTALSVDELWEEFVSNHNEGYVEMDSSVIVNNGRFFIPVRPVCELMGLTVNWNGDSNSVEITGDPDFIAAANTDMSLLWRETDEMKFVVLSVDNKGFYKDTEAISLYISCIINEFTERTSYIENEDNYHFDVVFECESDLDVAALVDVMKSEESLNSEHYIGWNPNIGPIPLSSIVQIANTTFDISYTESLLEW